MIDVFRFIIRSLIHGPISARGSTVQQIVHGGGGGEKDCLSFTVY